MNMYSHRNKPGSGFTLVEAVLALAIMCVTAFALMAASSRCLQVARTARNYHTAVFALDRAELEYPLLPTNDINDNIVEDVTYDNGLTFSRKVEPLESEDDSDPDMFVVRSRVSWSVKGKESFEEVATFLYNTNHP